MSTWWRTSFLMSFFAYSFEVISNNTLGDSNVYYAIDFAGNAGAFTLGGQSIRINGMGISNYSSLTQTLNFSDYSQGHGGISVMSSQFWYAGMGDLVIQSNVTASHHAVPASISDPTIEPRLINLGKVWMPGRHFGTIAARAPQLPSEHSLVIRSLWNHF